MEGSRIKTIVIIILALLNGFLLVLSGGRRLEDARSQERARTDAIEVIHSNGISLEEEIVPKQMELRPMQAARDPIRESAFASELLGTEVTGEHRGGEVYRYANASGSVQFHSTGEVLVQFEPGLYPLEGEDAAEHAAAVAALLDCRTQALESSVENGTGTVVLVQTLEDVSVLDCRLTAHYVDGDLLRLQGVRLPGRSVTLEAGSPISVATALIRLYNGLKEMGDIYSEIESIQWAYSMELERSGTVHLIPVWKVRTDTGDYLLDTMTGRLSRAAGFGGLAEQSEE